VFHVSPTGYMKRQNIKISNTFFEIIADPMYLGATVTNKIIIHK